MTETHAYLHTLTGKIAQLTEEAASVFSDHLIQVADDAKEYESELFQGGTVEEFLKNHSGFNRTKVENRDPAVKDDAAAEESGIVESPTVVEQAPATETTAEQTSTEEHNDSEGN